MKKWWTLLSLMLIPCFIVAETKLNKDDFIGLWYSVDFDRNVDTKHYLAIEDVKDGFIVKYGNHGDVFNGVLVFSEEQRGIVGLLRDFGKVVIRKNKAMSALSMDQITEIEDFPIGLFQKKAVLERQLGIKLP